MPFRHYYCFNKFPYRIDDGTSNHGNPPDNVNGPLDDFVHVIFFLFHPPIPDGWLCLAFNRSKKCLTDGIKGCTRHINFLFLLIAAGLITGPRHVNMLGRGLGFALRLSHVIHRYLRCTTVYVYERCRKSRTARILLSNANYQLVINAMWTSLLAASISGVWTPRSAMTF